MANIKKPSELQIAITVNALLFGQPGIGKTTLGLSAPEPLVFDFDRGLHRVNSLHLKDAVQVDKWEEVIDTLEHEDLSAYKTIVIDTAGKMVDCMTEFIIRKDTRLKQTDGSLSLKGYGARKVMFQDFFRRVRQLNKNVVLVAHEREDKDGDIRFIRPEIGGSSGNDLMKELDLVGYVQAIGKKRTVSFNATEKYYGKNSCKLPDVMEIPETDSSKNDFMVGIIAKYQQMINDKFQMMQEYRKLIERGEEMIESVTNAEQANIAVAELKSFEQVWDSKLQLARRLSDKAKSLTLSFNRESGVYEPLMSLPEEPKPRRRKQKADVETTPMVNVEKIDEGFWLTDKNGAAIHEHQFNSKEEAIAYANENNWGITPDSERTPF